MRKVLAMLIGFVRYAIGYVKGFAGELLRPTSADPDVLMSQAQQAMREVQARNRERMVEAITQKNNLRALAEQTQQRIDNLQAKAERAAHDGDNILTAQINAEWARCEQSLQHMKVSHASAVRTVDDMKNDLRGEEERLRVRTAEIFALQTEWKQVQNAASLADAPEADAARVLITARALREAMQTLARRVEGDLQEHAARAAHRGNALLAMRLQQECSTWRMTVAL